MASVAPIAPHPPAGTFSPQAGRRDKPRTLAPKSPLPARGERASPRVKPEERGSHRYRTSLLRLRELLHIPWGPRFIAAMPVRQTSISPSGFMMAMNCSILEGLPVISNTK